MFVPIQALIKEKPLMNVNDCVTALETYVLPKYKNETTNNIGFTKQECFGVLASFFQAGKLNPHMIPLEIEAAVETFMDDKLWIPREQSKVALVQHGYQPSVWFHYPLKSQVRDIFRMYLGVFVQLSMVTSVAVRLFLTNIIRFYKITISKFNRRTHGKTTKSRT